MNKTTLMSAVALIAVTATFSFEAQANTLCASLSGEALQSRIAAGKCDRVSDLSPEMQAALDIAAKYDKGSKDAAKKDAAEPDDMPELPPAVALPELPPAVKQPDLPPAVKQPDLPPAVAKPKEIAVLVPVEVPVALVEDKEIDVLVPVEVPVALVDETPQLFLGEPDNEVALVDPDAKKKKAEKVPAHKIVKSDPLAQENVSPAQKGHPTTNEDHDHGGRDNAGGGNGGGNGGGKGGGNGGGNGGNGGENDGSKLK